MLIKGNTPTQKALGHIYTSQTFTVNHSLEPFFKLKYIALPISSITRA